MDIILEIFQEEGVCGKPSKVIDFGFAKGEEFRLLEALSGEKLKNKQFHSQKELQDFLSQSLERLHATEKVIDCISHESSKMEKDTEFIIDFR